MGIINGLKRALGFGHDDEEMEEYDSSTAIYAAGYPDEPAEPTIPVSKPVVEPVVTPDSDLAANDKEETAVTQSVTLPEDIFDAVIEHFNAFQPEFVRNCLSLEKERRLLVESIAAKLANVQTAPAEHTDDSARIAELESQLAAREHTIREDKRYTDSLERQKSGLLDRISALETSMRHQNLRRINRRSADEAVAEVKEPAENQQEETAAEILRLTQELQRETALREQLEVKSKMADSMLTELRNAAASARKDLEEAVASHAAEISTLREQHANTLAEIAKEQESAVAEISDSITEFEGVKARLESRVADLQAELKAEREKSSNLSKEIVSLQATIETNLYNQANSEMKLRSEIKQLKEQLVPASAGAVLAADEDSYKADSPEKSILSDKPVRADKTDKADKSEKPEQPQPAAPRRRRGRPRKSVEAELDNPAGFMQPSRKDDPEFGYHEPPHRPVNDSAAQLSLF